jgi:hypothetical protein
MVHLGLNPTTILTFPGNSKYDWKLKIVDLGSVQVAGRHTLERTWFEETATYLPPEIRVAQINNCRSKKNTNHRAPIDIAPTIDVFSFGVILLRMIAPDFYEKRGRDGIRVFFYEVSGDETKLGGDECCVGDFKSEVGECDDLVQLVQDCLMANYMRRPQSGADLLKRLKNPVWDDRTTHENPLVEAFERRFGANHPLREKYLLSLDNRGRLSEVGNQLLQQQKYFDSLFFYDAAIALDPTAKEAAPVYSSRSLAFVKLGYVDEAWNDAKQSVDSDAQFALGHLRQAMLGMKLGLYRASNDSFEKYFALEPEALNDAEMTKNRNFVAKAFAEEEARWRKSNFKRCTTDENPVEKE